MGFKMGLLGKAISTQVTRIWLLTCMDTLMRCKVCFLPEAMSTVVTYIRLHTCMNPLMGFKMGLLCKVAAALSASIWFFACMGSSMVCETIRSSEAALTLITAEVHISTHPSIGWYAV